MKNPSFIIATPASLVLYTQPPGTTELYERLSSNLVLTPELKSFEIADLSFSRSGSSSVGGLSDYEISFTPPEFARANNGKIQVFFPKAVANIGSQTIACFYLRDALTSEPKPCTSTIYTGQTSINFIEITNLCSSPCSNGILRVIYFF